MFKCPACSQRRVPFYTKFLGSAGECGACGTIVSISSLAVKVSRIASVFMLLVIMLNPRAGLLVVALALVAQLVLSPLVPDSGPYPVGPSRSVQVLAPVIYVAYVAIFAYAVYWAFGS